MENKMTILGCSVIEDVLQEDLPKAVKTFHKANIPLWVITGDK